MKRVTLAILSVSLLSGGTIALAQGRGRGPAGGGGMHGGPPATAGRPDKPEGGHAAAGEPRVGREPKTGTMSVRNPALSSRLQGLLPAGMTVEAASAGFKNKGQFIAAAHVSRNLNIPFEQLKARMTGPNAVSLGDAIHAERPEVGPREAREQVKRAEKQAKEDIEQARKDESKLEERSRTNP